MSESECRRASHQPPAGSDDPEDLRATRLVLWARAHHEAAHAVVGTLLGGRVSDVELWHGPPVGGRVRLAGLDDPAADLADYALVRRIVYLLAGPIGERISGGGSGMIMNEPASLVAAALLAGARDPNSIDPATDLGMVANLILEHFGPDDEAGTAAAVDHLPLHVETLLRDRWHAVELIAVSLLRHGRLSGEQLHALFSDALPAPEMAALLDPSSA